MPRLLSLVCGAVAVRCLADRGCDPPIDRARRRRRGSLPPASRRSPQPPTGFDVETRYCPFRSPPADLLCKSRRYAGGDVEAVLKVSFPPPLPSPLSPLPLFLRSSLLRAAAATSAPRRRYARRFAVGEYDRTARTEREREPSAGETVNRNLPREEEETSRTLLLRL